MVVSRDVIRRDPGIRKVTIPNPGIEKNGSGIGIPNLAFKLAPSTLVQNSLGLILTTDMTIDMLKSCHLFSSVVATRQQQCECGHKSHLQE
jgi:hypothetical protein